MKLTLMERILLLNVLPEKGNMITLRIVDDLRRNLSLTEEEVKEYNVRTEEDKVYWDNVDKVKDVPVGEKALDVIVEAIKKMDRENALTAHFIPLYERFIEKKEVI